MSSKPKSNVFHASGKRKRAVARATIAPGKGAVRINHVSLDHFSNEIARARIREPTSSISSCVSKAVALPVRRMLSVSLSAVPSCS